MIKKESKIVEDFDTRVQECFRKQDKEIAAISKDTGISKSTLYRVMFEGGTCNIVVLAKLAVFFGVTTDYLIFGKS